MILVVRLGQLNDKRFSENHRKQKQESNEIVNTVYSRNRWMQLPKDKGHKLVPLFRSFSPLRVRNNEVHHAIGDEFHFFIRCSSAEPPWRQKLLS
jgi:hypothetical protein